MTYLVGGLVAGGTALAVLGPTVADVVGEALPDAATVRSEGTKYPGFSDARGWGYQLRVLGGILISAAVVSAFVFNRAVGTRLRAIESFIHRHRLPLFLALLCMSVVLYMYLSYPPNAWGSNARMHWVDQFYDRADNYFYTLVKLPHIIFYEVPHVWQGINGAISVALAYGIGRRVLHPVWGGFALAGAFLASASMLLFANMAEDVTLNISAILLVVYAYVRRWKLGVGVALFVAFLGRPQLSLLVIAFGLTHVCYWVWDRSHSDDPPRLIEGALDPFFSYNILAFTGLFAVWTGVLTALDARYFLTGSALIEQVSILRQPAREVDGFVLTPFSGAYAYHLLWIFPVPLYIANLYVAVRFNRLSRQKQELCVFSWLTVVLSLIFLEVASTSYYNIRYIIYYYPLLLVPGVLALVLLRVRGVRYRAGATAAAACVLLLSVGAPYTAAFTRRAEIQGRDLTTLYPDRYELRELAEDRAVYTAYSAHYQRNFLAYVLRTRFSSIKATNGSGGLPEGALLIRPAEEGAGSKEVLYSNGEVEAVRVESGG